SSRPTRQRRAAGGLARTRSVHRQRLNRRLRSADRTGERPFAIPLAPVWIGSRKHSQRSRSESVVERCLQCDKFSVKGDPDAFRSHADLKLARTHDFQLGTAVQTTKESADAQAPQLERPQRTNHTDSQSMVVETRLS